MARQRLNKADAVVFEEEAPVPALAQTSPPAAPGRLRLGATDKIELDQDEDEDSKPGKLESFGRGLFQGATLGFGDEAVGAAEALFSPRPGEDLVDAYRRSRDESRAKNKAAQDENPWTYGAAELGGGVAGAFVPGLGIAKGAKLATVAAKSGAAGALSGLGHSEADLTEGDVGGAVKDTAIGGTVGAIAGTALTAAGRGLAKGYRAVRDGAQGRIDQRLLSDAADRVPKSIRDKLADNSDDAIKLLREEGLDGVVSDPKAFRGKALEVSERLTGEIAEGVEDLNAADAMKAKRIIASLEKLKATYKTGAKADKVQKAIDDISARFVPEAPMSDKQLLQKLATGAKGNTKEQIGTRAKDTLAVARKWELDKAVSDDVVSAGATKDAHTTVGKALGEVYDRVDDNLQGVDFTKMEKGLQALQGKYEKNAALGEEASQVANFIQRMRKVHVKALGGADEAALEGFAPGDVPTFVKAREVRATISAIQGKANQGGSYIDPAWSSKVKREVGAVLKEALDEHLAEAGELQTVNALNKEFSVLSNLLKAAEKRAAEGAIKPDRVIPVSKSGNISVKEALALADEIGSGAPRQSKIASALDKVQTKKVPGPQEKAAEAIRNVVEKHLAKAGKGEGAKAVRMLEQKKELIDTFAKAGIYRDRLTPYNPTGIRDVTKDASLYKDLKTRALSALDPLKRKADSKLAKLAVEARERKFTSKGAFIDRAISMGIPMAVATKLAANWVRGDVDDEDEE